MAELQLGAKALSERSHRVHALCAARRALASLTHEELVTTWEQDASTAAKTAAKHLVPISGAVRFAAVPLSAATASPSTSCVRVYVPHSSACCSTANRHGTTPATWC